MIYINNLTTETITYLGISFKPGINEFIYDDEIAKFVKLYLYNGFQVFNGKFPYDGSLKLGAYGRWDQGCDDPSKCIDWDSTEW